MSEQKRRRFTAEFKIEAVRLVKEEKLSDARVAQDLGVRVDTLRKWIEAAEGRAGLKARDIFPGNGRLPALEEELRQLRRENEILRQEREILKKATAFFAREQR
jgi:transposase